MSEAKRTPGAAFMPAILRRLAPKLGAEVIFEPEFEIVGRIRFPNGRQSYFWHNKFNLNSVVSARIAQDKGYTTFFLQERGFRVPRSGVFFREDYCEQILCAKNPAAARAFAADLGWQVYLKPLRGSQGGGIIKACNEQEFDAAAGQIFACEKKVQVQKACPGRDYRIVVLDGEVLSAYERKPLQVCGDGVHTISELLRAMQAEFVATGRDTILDFDDPRLSQTLARRGLQTSSVLPAGTTEVLLDVANLSCGGTTEEITARLHPEVAALAASVCQALDLRFAGVDILMPDATQPPGDYAVLEVNSAPGLDHYAGHGADHEAHVDELYLKVLEAIARGPG